MQVWSKDDGLPSVVRCILSMVNVTHPMKLRSVMVKSANDQAHFNVMSSFANILIDAAQTTFEDTGS